MILDRLFAMDSRPAPHDDYWYRPIGETSSAGIKITPDSAMRVAAVYACVRVLAETLAQVPLPVYKRMQPRGKQRAPEHPLYKVLHDQPNRWQTAFEFREMLMGHVALRGNAYALIVPGANGSVSELIPLHPAAERMQPQWIPETRRMRYMYTDESGQKIPYSQDEIFHIRGLSVDGLVGLSPMDAARDAIGLSKAAEEHGAKVFANRATPAGVLEHPKQLSQKARERLVADFTANYSGSNAHRTLLLEEGLSWKQVGMTDQASQWIESRKFQISEIARIFRVPPHMIGDLERATFSNIEQQSLEFIQYTMGPWFVRWEQAILRDLIADSDTYFAEFLIDGLMRGDSAARSAFYSNALQNKWMNANEVRERENLNPIPGGDVFENPAIQVAPEEPAPADAPDDDDESAAVANPADVFASLLTDAAERIAAREINGLSRRVDKAAEDMPRFVAWLGDGCYDVHFDFIVQVMEPIIAAWKICTGQGMSAGMMASELTGQAVRHLSSGDVVAKVEAWKTTRAGEVRRCLAERFTATSQHAGPQTVVNVTIPPQPVAAAPAINLSLPMATVEQVRTAVGEQVEPLKKTVVERTENLATKADAAAGAGAVTAAVLSEGERTRGKLEAAAVEILRPRKVTKVITPVRDGLNVIKDVLVTETHESGETVESKLTVERKNGKASRIK